MNASKQSNRKLLIRIIIGLFCTFLAFVVYEMGWSRPFSKSKLKQLSIGMTTNQIFQILGQPAVDGRVKTGESFYWIYENPFHWQTVWVFFDERERYTQYNISPVGQ